MPLETALHRSSHIPVCLTLQIVTLDRCKQVCQGEKRKVGREQVFLNHGKYSGAEQGRTPVLSAARPISLKVIFREVLTRSSISYQKCMPFVFPARSDHTALKAWRA